MRLDEPRPEMRSAAFVRQGYVYILGSRTFHRGRGMTSGMETATPEKVPPPLPSSPWTSFLHSQASPPPLFLIYLYISYFFTPFVPKGHILCQTSPGY